MDTVWFSFVQILDILGDVSVSKLLGFETFPFFRWFRIRYWKNLVSKKSIGFGIENILYQKSIGFGIGRIWYREKVSDSVFVQILGIVTHWWEELVGGVKNVTEQSRGIPFSRSWDCSFSLLYLCCRFHI